MKAPAGVQGGSATGPANEKVDDPVGTGGHSDGPLGKKSTDTLAATGVAGAAQSVPGQLGHLAVSVKISVTVPPGNPTSPMPVGEDLARLIDFRHGMGVKAQAGPRLPAQGRADCGSEAAAMQTPTTSARHNSAKTVFDLERKALAARV